MPSVAYARVADNSQRRRDDLAAAVARGEADAIVRNNAEREQSAQRNALRAQRQADASAARVRAGEATNRAEALRVVANAQADAVAAPTQINAEQQGTRTTRAADDAASATLAGRVQQLRRIIYVDAQ